MWQTRLVGVAERVLAVSGPWGGDLGDELARCLASASTINKVNRRAAGRANDALDLSIIQNYFLSSLDSARFEPVRTFQVHGLVAFDTGKPALLGDLVPGVIGQDFGRGDDISRVVLASRQEGVDVEHIESFPCFVFIVLPPQGLEDLQTPVGADEPEITGWGELYRTAEDAANKVFD